MPKKWASVELIPSLGIHYPKVGDSRSPSMLQAQTEKTRDRGLSDFFTRSNAYLFCLTIDMVQVFFVLSFSSFQ